MGFLLPEYFEDLYNATSDIVNNFFILNERYTPPDLEILFINIEHEVKLYLKETTYFADRSSQAKVFTQLVLELKNDKELKHALAKRSENNISENDKKIIDKAQQIVLGALIHRLLRIVNENSVANILPKNAFLSFFSQNAETKVPKKCRLFEAIERILNLSEKNRLDSLTITTTCEALYFYMKEKNKYTKFAHYESDVNFIAHLTDIIESQKKLSQPITAQVNKLLFLTSMANYIDNINENVGHLITKIEARIPNKNTKVNIQLFNELTALYPLDEYKARFILMSKKINLSELEWKELFSDLRELLNINSIYSLLGVFQVIYFGQNEEKLKLVIRKTLHWTKDNDLYADTELMQHAFSFLKSWILDNDYGSNIVQWHLFEGKDIGKSLFVKEHFRIEQLLLHGNHRQQISL